MEGEAEVLLDPNTLSEDGSVSLSIYSFTRDAEHLAVGLSGSGSDWLTIKVLRVADREFTSDLLSWVCEEISFINGSILSRMRDVCISSCQAVTKVGLNFVIG